jgi:hypothetical protein
MSDRFEEAAIEWNNTHRMIQLPEGFLAPAFRWYHDRYLAAVKATVMALKNDGLITTSRAAELLDMSVSKLIEENKGACWRGSEDAPQNGPADGRMAYRLGAEDGNDRSAGMGVGGSALELGCRP